LGVKMPAISKGKLVSPERQSNETKLTTPQGIELVVRSKYAEVEFDNGGKTERAKIPTSIEVVVTKNDGWTVSPVFDGDPMPYMDATPDVRHEPILIKLQRTKAGPFGSDMREAYALDVFGDGRIEEQHTFAALHQKF
ncbi:MAG: hypothetical protein ABIP89_24735, partial [Polyangiaceae bacterium]